MSAPKPPAIPTVGLQPTGFEDHFDLCQIRPSRWRVLVAAASAQMEPQQPDEPDRDYLVRTVTPVIKADRWLQSVIVTAHALGHQSGVDVLEEACTRHAVVLPPPTEDDLDQSDETRHEFIARLCLHARTTTAAADVLREARVLVAAPTDKKYERYCALDAPDIDWRSEWETAIKEETSKFLLQKRILSYTECTAIVQSDTIIIRIVHAKHAESILDTTADGINLIRVRPAAHDIIRYIIPRGELLIATQSKPLTRHYLKLLGRLIFNDKAYFIGATMDIRAVLNERSLEVARRKIHGLTRVELKSIEFMADDGHKYRVTSGQGDLHTVLRQRALANPTCVYSAVLELRFIDPVDGEQIYPIRLRGAHEVKLDRHSIFEAAAEEFLWESGIYKEPNDRDPSNWWLHDPWSMAESRWKQVMRGKNPEPHIATGVLRKDQLPVVWNTEESTLDPVLKVGERSIITPASGSRPTTAASATDTSGLRWDPVAQARALAMRLGTHDAGDEIPELGVVDVGWRQVGPHRLRLFLLTRDPAVQPNALSLLSDRGRNCRVAGIVPTGQAHTRGAIPLVSCRLPDAEDDLLYRIIDVLGLTDAVEPELAAPPSASLICRWKDPIDSSAIRWRGLDHDLPLSEQSKRLIKCLSEAYPSLVDNSTIESACQSGREARQLVNAFHEELKKVSGLPQGAHKPIQNTRGQGYRLAIEPYPRGLSKRA